jgi:acyl carrier protein
MPEIVTDQELVALLARLAEEKLEIDIRGAELDSPLRSFGLDSLDQLELTSILEDELSVRIPDEKAGEIETVGDLVTCLSELQRDRRETSERR